MEARKEHWASDKYGYISIPDYYNTVIDPYLYQYNIERTIQAETWANKVLEENKKMIDGKDWISDLLFGYSEVHING